MIMFLDTVEKFVVYLIQIENVRNYNLWLWWLYTDRV